MFKKYLKVGVCIALVAFTLYFIYLVNQNNKLKKELEIKTKNELALMDYNNGINKENRVLHLTIDQLNYMNDSITLALLDTKDKLKIKDKEIESLSYLLSQGSKKDTVRLRDTILSSPKVKLDTLIGDKWLSNRLRIEYPGTIIQDIQYTSELNIIAYMTKETVKPPKKCKFLRWFQKKHRVLTVTVTDKNPYAKINEQKHIKIIK